MRLTDEIVMAGLILLAMLKRTSDGVAWGDGWHFPVPDLKLDNGTVVPAEVTSGMRGFHRGLDIMYRRRSLTDRQQWPAGVVDAQGAKQAQGYFAPIDTPILAARAGKVWSVKRIPQGWWVVIDHGKPWATSYHHLQSVAPRIAKGAAVQAGELIGTMGHNPNTDPEKGAVDGERLRHLHVEFWYKGSDDRASQDPTSVLSQWGRSVWTA